jgi:signal transduction histidine kinase/CheY-like chemotaxis protein
VTTKVKNRQGLLTSAPEKIQLHPVTLAFIGSQRHLEKTFLEKHFITSLPVIRFTLIFAALIYAAFGILDAYLVPEKKSTFWLIRFTFICPGILALYGTTFLPIFNKFLQPALAGIEILAGAGIVWMTILAPPPASYSYYAGLTLIIIVGYTVINMRFIWATSAGWVLVFLYEFTAGLLTNIPTPVLINNSFFLISANLIGMLACYLIEFQTRRDFFMNHLLEIQSDMVRQAKKQLEERVQERTEQLQETNLQLIREIIERRQLEKDRERIQSQLTRHQKMESIGLMAGGVAHDLNNILSGIISYPELLLMKLPEDSDLRKYVKSIKDSGNRAAAVVADLLTVARGVASEKEIICLSDLVEKYITSPEYKNLANRYPGIKLTFNPAPNLPDCKLSTIHMLKVLMNLINNAFEAIETEGEVIISTGECYIGQNKSPSGTELLEAGQYVILKIADNGPGISPNDVNHIFEPFYSKKVMGRSGTGLGLAVVWNTVQEHGGIVVVKSVVGHGTTFTIYLPVTMESSVTKETSGFVDLRGNGKILVVDDEALQRDISEQTLTHLGYEVVTAESGESALDYLRDHCVDLVLLDMLMDPGIDGLQTYTEIIKLHPEQKTIIISGFSKSVKVKFAMELGVAKFLKKPFSIKSLGMAVKDVLGSEL